MAEHLELEIRNMLKSKYAPREVATRLLDRLLDPALPRTDMLAMVNFVYNSGYFREFFQLLPAMFRERSKIPWAHYIEIVNRHRITPSKEVLEAVIKGAKRQEMLEDMSLTRAWDKWDPRFKEIRDQRQNERIEREMRQRELMLDKLGFFRNQRLVEEEDRVLKLLLKMYPDDPEIEKLQMEFTERWARHVITRRSSVAESERYERTETQLSDSELEYARALTQDMQGQLKVHPQAAFDFAITLCFMEFYEGALELLANAPSGPPRDWLQADLLLKCQRNIDCLQAISVLEIRYSGDPETAFACTYLKAQALNSLGQSSTAMDLLQSIVNIRPNFRSAASLLSEWRGGRGR